MAFFGDKGFADLAAFFGADWDVLEVRVARRQAPRIDMRHRKGRMDAARFGVYFFLQRVRIGGFELGKLAVIQNFLDDLMAFLGQFFEHIHRRGIIAALGLFASRKAHFAKQNFADLFGRGDVERMPGEFMNLHFQRGQLLAEILRKVFQECRINLDACQFHLGNHGNKRPFDVFVYGGHFLASKTRLERLVKAQGYIRVLGGIIQRLFNRHLIESDLVFAFARHVLVSDILMTEKLQGQIIHPVAVRRAVQNIGNQHRVIAGVHADAVPGENLPVVFHVMADFQNAFVFQ